MNDPTRIERERQRRRREEELRRLLAGSDNPFDYTSELTARTPQRGAPTTTFMDAAQGRAPGQLPDLVARAPRQAPPRGIRAGIEHAIAIDAEAGRNPGARQERDELVRTQLDRVDYLKRLATDAITAPVVAPGQFGVGVGRATGAAIRGIGQLSGIDEIEAVGRRGVEQSDRVAAEAPRRLGGGTGVSMAPYVAGVMGGTVAPYFAAGAVLPVAGPLSGIIGRSLVSAPLDALQAADEGESTAAFLDDLGVAGMDRARETFLGRMATEMALNIIPDLGISALGKAKPAVATAAEKAREVTGRGVTRLKRGLGIEEPKATAVGKPSTYLDPRARPDLEVAIAPTHTTALPPRASSLLEPEVPAAAPTPRPLAPRPPKPPKAPPPEPITPSGQYGPEGAPTLGDGFVGQLYSRVGRAIESFPQGKAQGRQWAAHLKKGTAQGERAWTGIDQFLEANADRALTRDEVMAHFNQNRLKLTETVVDHPSQQQFGDYDVPGESTNYKEVTLRLDRRNPDGSPATDGYTVNHWPGQQDVVAHLRFDTRELPDGTTTIFVREMQSDAHQAARKAKKRGERPYRPRAEIAEQTAAKAARAAAVAPARAEFEAASAAYHTELKASTERLAQETLERWRAKGRALAQHDEENARRMARASLESEDMETPELAAAIARQVRANNALLDAERAQGDPIRALTQESAAREGEYHAAVERAAQRIKEELPNRDIYTARRKAYDDPEAKAAEKRWHDAAEEARRARETDPATSTTVPDMPYKNTPEWTELILKRAIHEAAEQGVDRVTFVTGQQAADMFGLERRMDSLSWHTDDNGKTWELLDDEGGTLADGVPDAKLGDYVGEEIAEKIRGRHGGRGPDEADPDDLSDFGTIDKAGLKIGAQGMKGYYEGVVPTTINDYGKSLGVKIEIEQVGGIDNGMAREDLEAFSSHLEQAAYAINVFEGGPLADAAHEVVQLLRPKGTLTEALEDARTRWETGQLRISKEADHAIRGGPDDAWEAIEFEVRDAFESEGGWLRRAGRMPTTAERAAHTDLIEAATKRLTEDPRRYTEARPHPAMAYERAKQILARMQPNVSLEAELRQMLDLGKVDRLNISDALAMPGVRELLDFGLAERAWPVFDARAVAPEAAVTNPSIRMTPELRAATKQGMRLYAPGAAVGAATGAAVDQEDPLRGLALGAALGVGAGGLGGAADGAGAFRRVVRPTAATTATIAQEVRAVGRHGYVQLPEGHVVDQALEVEHLTRVRAIAEPQLAKILTPSTEVHQGAGLFGGDVSPNALYRFTPETPDAEIRKAAAIRGLVYGQDQQLWYRPAREGDATATRSVVFAGMNGTALSDEAIAEVLAAVRAEDALGPYGGATLDEGHLLFLNLQRYTGKTDEEFDLILSRVVAKVQSQGDIETHIGNFYTEHLDGPSAYFQALGQDPNALRQSRAVLAELQGEYARYARRAGADADATRATVDDRLDKLDTLAGAFENPPPLGASKSRTGVATVPLAVAARKVYRMFPRMKSLNPKVLVPRMVDRMETMVDDLVKDGIIPAEIAQNWYKGATTLQRKIIELVLPELKEQPKYVISTIANSIVSNGQEVPTEALVGTHITDQYLRTDRLTVLDPNDPGYLSAYRQGKSNKGIDGERGRGLGGSHFASSTRSKNHEIALQRLDAIVQAKGEAGAVEWLLNTWVPIKGGEPRPLLVELFGEKVGQYALDKMGLPSGGGSTIDLWMARMDYALRGDFTGLRETGPLNDNVPPAMRGRMQGVLAEYAKRHGVSESSAQALAWYAIKYGFRKAGAAEKIHAYATLASGSAQAVIAPPGAFPSSRITQGERGGTTGWTKDAKLSLALKRLKQTGTIAPTAGGFAGTVFSNPAGVALKAIGTRPLASAAVGAAAGAILDDENRLGGAVIGGLAGFGVGQTGKLLQNAATRRALTQGRDPDVAAVLGTIAHGVRPSGEPKRWLSGWQRAYTSITDESYPLKQMGRQAGAGETMTDVIRESQGWQAQADHHVKGRLEAIIEGIGDKYEDVMALAKAERDLNFRTTTGADKTGIDEDVLLRALHTLEADPETVAGARALQDYYRDLLELKRRNGVVSQEQYDAIVQSEDFYTPFLREWDDEAQRVGAGGGKFAQRGTGVRKMDREADARAKTTDPFEAAFLDTRETFRRIAKQRVTDAAVAIVDQAPQAVEAIMREVPNNTVSRTGRVVQVTTDGQARSFEILDQDLYNAFAALDPVSSDVFTKILGAVKTVKQVGVTLLPDFALANMIRDNAQVAVQVQRMIAARGATGAVLGAGLGAVNADEGERTRGALRGAGLGLGAGILVPQLAKTLHAAAQIAGNAKIYQQFVEDGGLTHGYYGSAPKPAEVIRAMRGIKPSILHPRSIWQALQWIGQVSEQGPRLSVYKTVLGEGGTRTQAVSAARDVSLNFSQRGAGRVAQFAGNATAFWNPKIQGWDKLARMLRNPKTAAVAAAALTAPTIALWDRNKDNPEYWARPLWERNLFWLVPKDEGGFYRIAKPFELGYVFASLPERMLDYAYQKQGGGTVKDGNPGESLKHAATDMAGQTLGGVIPIPNAVQPIIEQTAGDGGMDFFRNRPIVTSPKKPAHLQTDDRTSFVAKAIGELGERSPYVPAISPQRVDHLIRSATGAVGGLANDLIDRAARATGKDERATPVDAGLPVVSTLSKRFETRETGYGELEMTLRRRSDRAQALMLGLRDAEKQGSAKVREYRARHAAALRAAPQLLAAKADLDELADERRTVARDPRLSAEQRRARLRSIDATRLRKGQRALALETER